MQDRVSLYPGRVKLTPVPGQENTFDLVRADQPTQEGTHLNKASLLKDKTAESFGLGADSFPDDVLQILSRLHAHLGDDYLWRKQSISGVLKEATEPNSLGRMPEDDTFYYYDSVQLDLTNKKIVGVGEHKIVNQSNGSVEWDKVIGKYMLYPYVEDPWPVNTFYRVTKRDPPYDAIFEGYAQYSEFTLGPAQYLNSPNADAYPSGIVGNVQYDALGKIGNKLQIQTGTYVGSGVYTSDNQNSLTFNFVPKIVIVMKETLTGLGSQATFIYIGQPGYTSDKLFTLQDKTLYWHSSRSATNQCNESGTTYYYVAIG